MWCFSILFFKYEQHVIFTPYFEGFSTLKIFMSCEFVVYNFIDHNIEFIIYDEYEPQIMFSNW